MGEQLQQLAVPYLITFGIALLVSVLVGPVLIPFLHKLKFGQEIREEGPPVNRSTLLYFRLIV